MRKPFGLHCSFCGKSQHDVKKLVAGPRVHICDECVDACITILGDDQGWCERRIAELERLRDQPRESGRRPIPPEPQRRDGLIGRLAGLLRRLPLSSPAI